MRRTIGLCLVGMLLPAWLCGQSLGEIARKERERREKNKKEGVAVREITEEEILENDTEETTALTGPDTEGASGAESEESAFRSEPLEVSLEPSPAEELDRERRDRRREEAEWRARSQRAKRRVATARERKELLDGLFLAEGEKYVDAYGNVVVESLEHLRRLVREANEELEAAERALADLQEEARRAGIPPGWLR